MAIKITIPEPCNENWHRMTPTQKGAFCNRCEKEVIDFTRYSNLELARRIRRGDTLCGRFIPAQLNNPLPALTRNRWRERMAALGFTALLAASCAPEEDFIYESQKVHAVDSDLQPCLNASEEIDCNSRIIHGRVVDDEIPLPGANVLIKGTRIGVQTDWEGYFSLEIPEKLGDRPIRIVVSYIGYEIKEIRVNSEMQEIKLKMEEAVLGGLAIVEERKPTLLSKLFKRVSSNG